VKADRPVTSQPSGEATSKALTSKHPRPATWSAEWVSDCRRALTEETTTTNDRATREAAPVTRWPTGRDPGIAGLIAVTTATVARVMHRL